MPIHTLNSVSDLYSAKNNGSLVFIYAEYCGWCQRTKPEIKKLSSKYNIFTIDSEDEKFSQLLSSLKINGYPSFLFIKDANKNNYIKFSGYKTAEQLENIMKNL